MKKTQIILLAGGTGERFGGNVPKQFVKIAGKTVIEHTLARMEAADVVSSVIIVVHNQFYDYMNDLLLANSFWKVKKVVIGGTTRQESSWAGLNACDADTEYVLLHDAIRPFVSEGILRDTVEALERYAAVDVAISCADTIIQVDDTPVITDIPKRKYLMRGQTPQGFHKSVIEEAYRRYFLDPYHPEMTDDCGIVRYYGLAETGVVYGSEQNIKITYQEDLYLADKLFQIHSVDGGGAMKDEDVFSALRGKVGLIFGAGGGIGGEMLNLLNENGCTAYGYSRRTGCDICDADAVARKLREVNDKEGHIDYVINTAAVLKIRALEAMDKEEIESMIDVDYTGAVHITRLSLPYLRHSKGSLLLFTSSSFTRGRAMYSIYSSVKAAIVNFVQAVAEETAHDGIRINAINPERTDTPMRRNNFGMEDPSTLLKSRTVAMATLRAVLADYTGQVVDVRKDREKA